MQAEVEQMRASTKREQVEPEAEPVEPTVQAVEPDETEKAPSPKPPSPKPVESASKPVEVDSPPTTSSSAAEDAPSDDKLGAWEKMMKEQLAKRKKYARSNPSPRCVTSLPFCRAEEQREKTGIKQRHMQPDAALLAMAGVRLGEAPPAATQPFVVPGLSDDNDAADADAAKRAKKAHKKAKKEHKAEKKEKKKHKHKETERFHAAPQGNPDAAAPPPQVGPYCAVVACTTNTDWCL